MKPKIYHNPRCSKSRRALALIRERGIDIEVVEYMKSPLSKQELQDLLRKLGIGPRDLIRTFESEFKSAGVTGETSDDALLDLMLEHRRIIQRPIIEIAERAVVGRPPERALELLA